MEAEDADGSVNMDEISYWILYTSPGAPPAKKGQREIKGC
jgi:hypothetical protein